MREPIEESPLERGEVTVPGRCQACGQIGDTIAVPGAPPPNQLCKRCAIEYQDLVGEEDEDELH